MEAGAAGSFEQQELTRYLARADAATESVFRILLEQFERLTPYKISFDDYSGIFESIPRLRIPFYFKRHHADFCQFAKQEEQGFRDCSHNKHAVVGVMFRRPRSLCGQCHLGLTELVVPLVFRGRMLGAFYAGAAVLKGTEKRAKEKIVKYAERRQIAAAPYLEQLAQVPRMDAEGLARLRQEVETLKTVVLALLADWDPPLEQFKIQRDGFFTDKKKLPPLMRRTVGLIEQRYREPIKVQEIAGALGCHPYHLGKIFRLHMEMGVMDYLHEVRVQHACILLRAPYAQTEAISSEVGYQTLAHFCRVFKARRGMTPPAYRKTQLAVSADKKDV
jgi:AraC-like DNA-binding protein/ligand-binding sensor protein